jgi:hypothetical protein
MTVTMISFSILMQVLRRRMLARTLTATVLTKAGSVAMDRTAEVLFSSLGGLAVALATAAVLVMNVRVEISTALRVMNAVQLRVVALLLASMKGCAVSRIVLFLTKRVI